MPWRRIRASWARSGDALDPVAARSLGEALAREQPVLVLEQVAGDAVVVITGEAEPGARTTQNLDWKTFTLRNARPVGAEEGLVGNQLVLMVRVFAAEDGRDQFRGWLDEEHSRLQLTVPGVHWYLGYEQTGGDHSFLNLWGIDDAEVVDSEAWSRVRDTAWWLRVQHVPAGADRGIYRVISPSPVSAAMEPTSI